MEPKDIKAGIFVALLCWRTAAVLGGTNALLSRPAEQPTVIVYSDSAPPTPAESQYRFIELSGRIAEVKHEMQKHGVNSTHVAEIRAISKQFKKLKDVPCTSVMKQKVEAAKQSLKDVDAIIDKMNDSQKELREVGKEAVAELAEFLSGLCV